MFTSLCGLQSTSLKYYVNANIASKKYNTLLEPI